MENMVGFRFQPTDSEVLHYLLNKLRGLPLPCNNVILDCDLYDGKERWTEIFHGRRPSYSNSLYVFTKLKKITSNGRRIQRCTASGTWKETQKDRNIYLPEPRKAQRIGTRKSFKFVPAKGSSTYYSNGRWLMDEYRLDSTVVDQTSQKHELVLCRIKYEKETRSKINVQQFGAPSTDYATTTMVFQDEPVQQFGAFPYYQSTHNATTIVAQDEPVQQFGAFPYYQSTHNAIVAQDEPLQQFGAFSCDQSTHNITTIIAQDEPVQQFGAFSYYQSTRNATTIVAQDEPVQQFGASSYYQSTHNATTTIVAQDEAVQQFGASSYYQSTHNAATTIVAQDEAVQQFGASSSDQSTDNITTIVSWDEPAELYATSTGSNSTNEEEEDPEAFALACLNFEDKHDQLI